MTALADLAAYISEPLAAVTAAAPRAGSVVLQQWQAWGGDGFFEQEQHGRAYAFMLAYWHDHGGGVPVEYTPTAGRLLDYGAGIGTFALAAAGAGADVTIVEPNPWLRAFALWRARRRGVTMRTEVSGLYDTVVCWQAFGYMTDPVTALGAMRGLIGPGGALITDTSFDVTASPMHMPFVGDWDAEVRKAAA